MVFFVDPKKFSFLQKNFPKHWMNEEQNLNVPDIEDVVPNGPDPAMIESVEKKTTTADLGEAEVDEEDMGLNELYGQGFRVNGGRIRKSKNDKLRKFISLKL